MQEKHSNDCYSSLQCQSIARDYETYVEGYLANSTITPVQQTRVCHKLWELSYYDIALSIHCKPANLKVPGCGKDTVVMLNMLAEKFMAKRSRRFIMDRQQRES